MSTLFDPAPAKLRQISVQQIRPDPEQPRKEFDADALAELAASIKSVGVLQPILVRQDAGSVCTILYGERRWRAARLAGLQAVPCLVLPTRTEKLMRKVVQCSENAHHRDLAPLEYVDAISEMLAAGLGTAAIAQALGKRVDWVRGHEVAANPAYRALFETGRLESVDTLAHFRSLPDRARRELLDSGERITSTKCAHLRQKYRTAAALGGEASVPRQAPSDPAGSPTTPAVASDGGCIKAERAPGPAPNPAARDGCEDATAAGEDGTGTGLVDDPRHTIISLAVPSPWIQEAGGVEVIRHLALAALAQCRHQGWQPA
jgi:ParB/RepB/Spo0J family partition protein